MICGTTAWGWLQGNSGKLLVDFPFARFCDYIGVKVTDNYANCSNPIVFDHEKIAFRNVHRTVEEFSQNPTNLKALTIIGSAIKELGDTLPGVPMETLRNIVMNVNNNVVPGNTCPVRKQHHREQSTGICGIMCGLPGIKAPGLFSLRTQSIIIV